LIRHQARPLPEVRARQLSDRGNLTLLTEQPDADEVSKEDRDRLAKKQDVVLRGCVSEEGKEVVAEQMLDDGRIVGFNVSRAERGEEGGVDVDEGVLGCSARRGLVVRVRELAEHLCWREKRFRSSIKRGGWREFAFVVVGFVWTFDWLLLWFGRRRSGPFELGRGEEVSEQFREGSAGLVIDVIGGLGRAGGRGIERLGGDGKDGLDVDKGGDVGCSLGERLKGLCADALDGERLVAEAVLEVLDEIFAGLLGDCLACFDERLLKC
jgi:hypothetical protein